MFDDALEAYEVHRDLPGEQLDAEVAHVVRRILLRLASDQEQAAADEAAHIQYWQACPDSVVGCRAAAQALRSVAESMQPQFSIQ